jgi:hypothetical protein
VKLHLGTREQQQNVECHCSRNFDVSKPYGLPRLVGQSQSQSCLTTDSQSGSFSWCQATIRARDQLFFLLEIVLRQLKVCFLWRPLQRENGSVICYCSLASLAQSLSGLSPVGLNVLLLQFLRPQNWKARSAYLYPPGTGWPSYTPGHWVTVCYRHSSTFYRPVYY